MTTYAASLAAMHLFSTNTPTSQYKHAVHQPRITRISMTGLLVSVMSKSHASVAIDIIAPPPILLLHITHTTLA